MAIIGIDLGTTNSLISLFKDGKPELIANAQGKVLTPSAVAVDADGSVLVGAVAREIAVTRPGDAVYSFKRWMGSDRSISIRGKAFRAEELSAFVLRSLLDDLRRVTDEPITEVIISCPAYFNDAQRKATINAARLAGLKVDRLVNEPTAAILAYGLGTQQEGQFLVFDLEGVVEVHATAGDNYLGGDDFTEALVRLICRQNARDLEKLSTEEKARLIKAADAVKIELSTTQAADYRIMLGANVLSGKLTREDFEVECSDLIRRLRQPLERALRDATISHAELDAIILVGGATRMPVIRQTIARLFGKLPYVNINPDEVVAHGAAIQAALKARHEAVEDVLLTDVCPFTLGIASTRIRQDGRREDIVSPIIQRNATVPISRMERFQTLQNNQRAILVQVYQGENLQPEHNILIGTLEAKVPPRPAGEETIDVRFTYDINGALEVEVTVVSTGKLERAIFANASGLTEPELAERFVKLSEIKLAPAEHAENQHLIARAERLYAEALDQEREMIIEAILRFKADIDDQRLRKPEKVRDEFRSYLDRIDTHVFSGH